jgi:hypothetical protein
MTTELETALAEIKFGYEIDEKTAGDMIDYSEDILKEHDALILALAKAAIFDRLASHAVSGSKIVVDAEFASRMHVEIGKEVARILKPQLDHRAQLAAAETPGFRA